MNPADKAKLEAYLDAYHKWMMLGSKLGERKPDADKFGIHNVQLRWLANQRVKKLEAGENA